MNTTGGGKGAGNTTTSSISKPEDIHTPHTNTGVHIYNLLLAGWHPPKIAKHLGISRTVVWRNAHRFERNNKIERICKYPAMWRAKTDVSTPYISSGKYTPPLLTPHKLGASFILIGQPRLPRRNKKGVYIDKQTTHTALVYPSKTVIWLKSFTGNTVKEQIDNGHQAILALAKEYEQSLGVTLTFNRWFEDVEWVLNDKPASKEMAQKADIKPARVIAGATFKFDSSHPVNLEINTAPGFPKTIPTDHAATLEYLLLHAPYLLKQLVDSIVAVNMKSDVINSRLEALTEEIRRKG